jgi:hypothetical protein
VAVTTSSGSMTQIRPFETWPISGNTVALVAVALRIFSIDGGALLCALP